MSSKFSIVSKVRFDDVGEVDENGYVEYEYRGFHYEIAIEDECFKVRTYDDQPHSATVISPTNAVNSRFARHLIEFVKAEYKVQELQFYNENKGFYERVDPHSLKFTP